MGMFVGSNGGNDGFSAHSMPVYDEPRCDTALEAQSAQLTAKDAEIERLNIEFRYKQDECNYHYGAACEEKADLARVTEERDAAINEVCMKCKPSEIVDGLAFYDCDGCRWRTPAKQDEEE